ncbi:MAG: hypothetical protein Q8P12_08105, partial [bacterium]|nr:hypothetical protein [bacterium]
FKLPDHYALDYHARFDIYGVLKGIPDPWRSYMAGGRPDISQDDFASGGAGFTTRRYSAVQLQRRQDRGIQHDVWASLQELGFLNEVPENTVLEFESVWAGAQIEVYRTGNCPPTFSDRDASSCKTLDPEPIFTGRVDEHGRVAIGNPFPGPEGTIVRKEGVLFIRVTLGEEIGIRWLDIRDFNLAHWTGFTESVRMRMNLASFEDLPSDFDWTVVYEEVN